MRTPIPRRRIETTAKVPGSPQVAHTVDAEGPPTVVPATTSTAKPTVSISKKVSHNLTYGVGKFDAVFYTVSVTVSQEVGEDGAEKAVAALDDWSNRLLVDSRNSHVENIVSTLYPELFEEYLKDEA